MGKMVGRYELVKQLATGGMAEVWLAQLTGIEGFVRPVVIKRLLPSLLEEDKLVAMFFSEARLVSRLNHPNIVQLYDLGRDGDTFFIAMEFVHGEDLRRVMKQAFFTSRWPGRPVSLRIVATLCEALHHAHTRLDPRGQPMKLVHRDVSPANVLLGFNGTVKLADFGIARTASMPSNTNKGTIRGKLIYMAPEQATEKPVDHRADIFAAGLVLYELLTGVRPLQRKTEFETVIAAREGDIRPPSQVVDLPKQLESLVMKALARDPALRYPTARIFQVAIENELLRQRKLMGSAEISDMMAALFTERIENEKKTGSLVFNSHEPQHPDDRGSPIHPLELGGESPTTLARIKAPTTVQLPLDETPTAVHTWPPQK